MDALSNGKKAPYGPATITVEKHKDYFMTQHGTLRYLWYWLKKWLDFRSPWSWTNSWWIKRYLKNGSIPHKKKICKASYVTRGATTKKVKVTTSAGHLSSLNFDRTFDETLLSHSERKNGFPQSTDTGSSKKSAVTEKVATSAGHLSSLNFDETLLSHSVRNSCFPKSTDTSSSQENAITSGVVTEKVDTSAGYLSSLHFHGTLISHSENRNRFLNPTDTGSSKESAVISGVVTEKVATSAGHLSSLDFDETFDGTFDGTLLSHSKRKNDFLNLLTLVHLKNLQ